MIIELQPRKRRVEERTKERQTEREREESPTMRGLLGLIILLAFTCNLPQIQGCNRVPLGVTAAKSPVDDNFALNVANNAQSYVPGQKYNGESKWILRDLGLSLIYISQSH